MAVDDPNSIAPLLEYRSRQCDVEVCSEPGRLTITLPPSPIGREIILTCLTAILLAFLSFAFATPLTQHWFSRRVYTFELIVTPFSIIFGLLLLDSLLRIYRMARRAPEPACIVIDKSHISISSTLRGRKFFRAWPREDIAAIEIHVNPPTHPGGPGIWLRVVAVTGNWVLLKHKYPPCPIPADLQQLINTCLPPRKPHGVLSEFNFERWI